MSLLLKDILFAVLIPGTVAVYVPLYLAPADAHPFGSGWGFQSFIALTLLLFGAAVSFWCVWHFAVYGRGTPAPVDAPKHLVVSGPYRFVRNPMYEGVMIVILSWAVLFASVEIFLYCLVVGFCITCFILFYEEPTLKKRFGADYERYCREVDRWLPKLPRG